MSKMWSYFVSIVLFITITITSVKTSGENPIKVQVEHGQIVGQTIKVDQVAINQFLGVPYAQPPVGDLRFKKPLPVKPWSEPIEALSWPNSCHQSYPDPSTFHHLDFSEDCLYLNIWSPKSVSESPDSLRPVMFWIHGGALLFGSSVEDHYNGQVLAAMGDVVVVTINYRVNTLGFLYTGTDDAPGNMGLWDQNLALEWVNDNIRYFGGDPKRITVFGESAGGWSTSLHILSPMSRNLFQNAIVMSGASINRMAGDSRENILKNWLIGAKAIGCTDEDITKETTRMSDKVIECLKQTAPEKLAKIPLLPELTENLIGWTSQVVIDGTFLPERPLQMLNNGDFKTKINLLVGTVEDEGSFVLEFYVDPIKYNGQNPANISLTEAYQELSQLSSKLLSKKPINGQSVAKLYFNGLSDSNCQHLLRRTIGIAIGDFLLACPVLQFAKTLYENDRNSRVFQYYYTSKLGEPKLLCSHWMGSCHFDDIYPVFGVPFYKPTQFTDEERVVSQKMIKIFTDFAKTGTPSPQNGAEWPEYYSVNGHTIEPYYEISDQPKRHNNFGNGLKINECQYLWKPYIDLQ